jgi:hypothetical protein
MNTAEFQTGIRSKWYIEKHNLLIGYPDKNMKIIAIQPEDNASIYYWTRYLQDDELNYINNQRKINKLSIFQRLAYIGNGRYIPVNNQKQRIETEKRIFNNEKILNETKEFLKKSGENKMKTVLKKLLDDNKSEYDDSGEIDPRAEEYLKSIK